MAYRFVFVFFLILLCGLIISTENHVCDIWLILDTFSFFDSSWINSPSSTWKPFSDFFVKNFDITDSSIESQTRICVCRGLDNFNEKNQIHNNCCEENADIFADDWKEFNQNFTSTSYEHGDRKNVKDIVISKFVTVEILFKIFFNQLLIIFKLISLYFSGCLQIYANKKYVYTSIREILFD